jgi:hypothetical protein
MAGQATYILLPLELRLTQINRTKWEQGRIWWEPHAFGLMFRCKKRHYMSGIVPSAIQMHGTSMIKLLGKDPAVSGIKITGGDMPPCEDCMKGKKIVRISRGPPAQPTTQPLELIHIGTDGPWQVGSLKRPGNISPIPAGSVHFLAITDDFTGYVWVYFYKEKSQFLSCLKHFKPMVENQRKDGLKIQRARMDGAKEFSSHEAEALMKERDERQ